MENLFDYHKKEAELKNKKMNKLYYFRDKTSIDKFGNVATKRKIKK